jgi:colicin import membrane protein
MPNVNAKAKQADLKTAAKNAATKGITRPKHKSAADITAMQEENTRKFLAGSTAQPDAASESGVDTPPSPMVQSGFSVFNSGATMTETTKPAGPTAEDKAAAKAAREQAAAVKAQAAADKQAAALKKKEDREVAKAAAEKAKADAKTEREAKAALRKAELAANPLGEMHALRDAKDRYVKGSTGRLRSTDPLATALDAVQPAGVIQLAMQLLQLETNPYAHLNVGQQSMNLRNKMRGAINKKVFTIEQLVAERDARNLEADTKAAAEAKEAKAKAAADAKQKAADAKAAADADKAAKAAAKAATPATTEQAAQPVVA